MARKQYTGAKLTVLALAGAAVMSGTAWLGANQPATVTQEPAADTSAATAVPTATATTRSTQPATRAKKSRAS